MAFEWDDEKDKANFKKHCIRFGEAATIFEGPTLTNIDHREEGELREISFGFLGAAIIIAVVHTDRAGVTRIISARKATKRERSLFYAHLKRALGGD